MVQMDLDDLIACHEWLRRQPNESTCGKDESDFVLSSVEHALRNKGDLLEQSIAAAKTADQKQTKTVPKQKRKAAMEAKAAEVQRQISADETDEQKLARIEETVAFSENGRFVNAEKYDDFFFRLNTGYEFVAVDRFLDKGEPRIAFLVNTRLGGGSVTDAVDGFHWRRYGGRLSFTSQLESSAEVTPTLDQSSQQQTSPQPTGGQTTSTAAADDQKAKNDQVTKTFNFELQYTWVFFRTRVHTGSEPEDTKTAASANLRHYLGLLLVAGGLKTDDQPKIAGRTYAGLRWAVNPELYTDVLWGKTSGLRSDRVEVRGQLPVFTLDNGDKVYLGGIGNFALNKRHRELAVGSDNKVIAPPESDAVRVYVTFNTDLKRILGGKN